MTTPAEQLQEQQFQNLEIMSAVSEVVEKALASIDDIGAQIEVLARVNLAVKFITVNNSEAVPRFTFDQEKFEKMWIIIAGIENIPENE